MRSAVTLAIMALIVGASPVLAQGSPQGTPPAPPAAAPTTAPVGVQPPIAKPAATAPATAKAGTATAAAAQKCMRLPLSDIAVGRPETIAQAQLRLKEYSEAEAKRRGWKGTLVKSAETVSCEDYLYLPVIGQEYKCLVTATFCVK